MRLVQIPSVWFTLGPARSIADLCVSLPARCVTIATTIARAMRTRLANRGAPMAVGRTSTITVDDETTAEDLGIALGYVNYSAKRSQTIVGPVTYGERSEWDRWHERLNAMLTDWQARAHV